MSAAVRTAPATSLMPPSRASCLDQATQDAGRPLHDPAREPAPRRDGVLRLTYVQNRGAAFGILSDADLPYQSLLFAVVSLAPLGAIAAYAWRLPARSGLPADGARPHHGRRARQPHRPARGWAT